MAYYGMFKRVIEFETARAEEIRTCKRKAVAAIAMTTDPSRKTASYTENGLGKEMRGWNKVATRFNGPSVKGHQCSGEVGNCGCSHAEPRLILDLLDRVDRSDVTLKIPKYVLVCRYSPCTNCANIIIDSELFDGLVYDIVTTHDKRGLELLSLVFPVLSLSHILAGEDPDKNPQTAEYIDATIARWESSCSAA